jgi:hypothetical protein
MASMASEGCICISSLGHRVHWEKLDIGRITSKPSLHAYIYLKNRIAIEK